MRYLYNPVFTFLLAGSLALGGCQTTRKADRHFENFDYALAIDEYQEALPAKNLN
ncbi:hypothetical protein [Rufibacter ruber]|uniref:hypothetical protein n=1 Tax=Rufibacter ruber TaxID=1783499 RepID=UPI000A4E6408|nr:hypothetical protein [Rufibacter ruber]